MNKIFVRLALLSWVIVLLLFFIFIFLDFFFNYLFGCIGSSLLCMGFVYLWGAGTTLHCCVWASHHSGFSCCATRALGVQASVVVVCRLSSCGSQVLERRLSSCGTRTLWLLSMWDLPRPGLEPVSPALAGGF